MAEPKKEKKKQSLNKIIIFVLLFLVVLGGSFATYTLFFNKKTVSSTVSTKTTSSTSISGTTSAITYSLDECLVNLTDQGGKSYLKVIVFLGYENKKLTSELETKKPIIRDVVINTLRSKSTGDFSSNKAEKIKTEIMNKINPLLTKGQLDNVYFDDILVQ